jgi:predicted GNAT family N-acyltransferase
MAAPSRDRPPAARLRVNPCRWRRKPTIIDDARLPRQRRRPQTRRLRELSVRRVVVSRSCGKIGQPRKGGDLFRQPCDTLGFIVRVEIRIEALRGQHDRKGFSCGVAALDRYLKEFAAQDIKRRVSNCFLGIGQGDEVAGYYTFAATSLPLTDLPPEQAKKLPRYPLVPAGLIGRLAVSTSHPGQRVGGALIMDAVLRAARSDPAIFAIVVDAKDDRAASFYEHVGFKRLASHPGTLFVPVAMVLQALEGR